MAKLKESEHQSMPKHRLCLCPLHHIFSFLFLTPPCSGSTSFFLNPLILFSSTFSLHSSSFATKLLSPCFIYHVPVFSSSLFGYVFISSKLIILDILLIAFTFPVLWFPTPHRSLFSGLPYPCPTQFLPLLDLFFSSHFLFSSSILAPSKSWCFSITNFPVPVGFYSSTVDEWIDWLNPFPYIASHLPVSHLPQKLFCVPSLPRTEIQSSSTLVTSNRHQVSAATQLTPGSSQVTDIPLFYNTCQQDKGH